MSSISKLVFEVKSCNPKKYNKQKVLQLSASIFKEWVSLKNKHRKKVSSNDKKIFCKYEAEEQILIGLILHLNEKLVNSLII